MTSSSSSISCRVAGLSEVDVQLIEKQFDLSKGDQAPLALWIIGRPAAGKTTTATLLQHVLRQAGHRVELVDGEAVRSALHSSLGYSATDRLMAFKNTVHINQLLQSRGIVPITATIAGFRDFRKIVRASLENPRFIYLDCPFDVVAKRDRRGLYRKALAGKVKNCFGVDIDYEPPVQHEMRIDSARLKPPEIVATIVEHLEYAGLLRQISRT